MKQGRTIGELAAEIERQRDAKRDFIAPTDQVQVTFAQPTAVESILDAVDLEGTARAVEEQVQEAHDSGEAITVASQARVPVIDFPTNGGNSQFPIRPHAHGQISQRLEIPKRYYDRCRAEAPELWAEQVNHWLHAKNEKRLLRTLDGDLRAFLSNKYRPLDNPELAQAVLAVLGEFQIDIVSSEITENRLYIQAVRKDLQAEIEGSPEVGDVVESGIVISNSEIGAGSLSIEPLIYRLVCENGLISKDSALRKYHTGRGKGKDIEVAYELLRDETKRKTDEAFWLQVQDLTRAALDGAVFQDQVNALTETVGHKIESTKIEKVVEVTAEKLSLNDDERGSVLKHLIEGGDLSQYGLINAVTRTAEDVESYDRSIELERAGSTVLELPQREWKEIAEAA
jgi:hypothetical protein